MKRYTILILLCLTCAHFANAQRTVLVKFIIKDARFNQKDVTPSYTSANSYFEVYKVPNDSLTYLANVMEAAGSESSGPIYNIYTNHIAKTDTSFEIDRTTFDWSYANSYDSHKGTAKIEILHIHKPNGIAFELTMITEALDVWQYKGYLDGSLNLHGSN